MDFRDFDTHLTAQGFRPASRAGYIADLRRFAEWLQAHGTALTPAALNSEVIAAYRQQLLSLGYQPSTINRRLAALRAYTQFLNDHALQASPDFQFVQRHRPAPRWLNDDELEGLHFVIERNLSTQGSARGLTAQRDALLLLFLLRTGLRLSEAIQLRICDLQLEQSQLQVADRRVDLSDPAIQILREWLARRPEADIPQIWVIAQAGQYRPLSLRAGQRILQRLAEQAGLDCLNSHICRYTYAIHETERGVPLDKIAHNMGHANASWLYRFLWLSRHEFAYSNYGDYDD